MSSKARWQEPIAIVGMACRLPGDINKPLDLWKHVSEGRSSARDVPQSRFNADSFLTLDPSRTGLPAISRGHFLDRDIQDFDHRFFEISKDDAAAMDPQHRQLLEVTYECFESAGISTDEIRGSNIGCFCGIFTSDYHDMQMRDPENLPTFMAIGTTRCMLANRVSYAFDLRGPSITMDTACSTSLVSLHVACQALHAGECDGAVVGATNLFLNPEIALAMARFGILAEDGQTRTFDKDANGYGRAEGVNAVFVKRLSDAIRDGDQIRGVIRATSTNSDGAMSNAITMPSSVAQADCIRQAYSQAGIDDLGQTGYFECHGTATTTGDPIEVSAVSSVFAASRGSQDPLWIGSTKPNLGHSEPASGLTSLIKIAMALEAGRIPPNINFHNPNPSIDFEALRVQVPTETLPWPEKGVKRASINSFGIGGSNAHVIVDSFEGYKSQIGPIVQGTNHPVLLFVTGVSKMSLKMNASRLLEFLDKRHNWGLDMLAQLAREVNIRSQVQLRPFRASIVANRIDELTSTLRGLDIDRISPSRKSTPRKLLFVFTGQGAFWSQMGKGLVEAFPVAMEVVNQLDDLVGSLQSDDDRWSLKEMLLRDLTSHELDSPELAQPLCTAVQIALVDLLSSWGVYPDMVIGHSSGEIAAAYACRAISASEAITIAYYRGVALKAAPVGGMMSVNMAPESPRLKETLERAGIHIACFNSYGNVTLSGPAEGIQAAQSILNGRGIACRVLPVTRPYHTKAMACCSSLYFKLLEHAVHPKNARLPMYSTVTGREVNGSELNARYWETNLRVPVLYAQAVEQSLDSKRGCDVFVEIGPHRLLSRPTQDIQKVLDSNGPQRPYLSTIIRHSDTPFHMVTLAGHLVVNGYKVCLDTVNGALPSEGRPHRRSIPWINDLPTYAWDYSSSPWIEPRISSEWRSRRARRHELLGSRIHGGDPLAPTWRNITSQSELPWIVDHQINGVATMPITGYVAMAIEALMQAEEERHPVDWTQQIFKILDLSLSRSIILPDEALIEIFVSLRPVQTKPQSKVSWFQFTVSSLRDGIATTHCEGRGATFPVNGNHVSWPSKRLAFSDLPVNIPVDRFYRSLEGMGYVYGPRCRLLSEARGSLGSKICLAQLKQLSGTVSKTADQRYIIHPTLLDSALQTTFFADSAGYFQEYNTAMLPSRLDEIVIRMPTNLDVFPSCRAAMETRGFGHAVGTVQCFQDDATALFSIAGLQMDQVIGNNSAPDPWIRLVWRPDWDDILQDKSISSLAPRTNPATTRGIRELEHLTQLIIALLDQEVVEISDSLPSHMHLFRLWLRHHADQYRRRIPASDEHVAPKLTSDLVKQAASDSGVSQMIDTQLTLSLMENMRDIFEGKTEALEVLLEDNKLNTLYEDSLLADNINRHLSFAAELLAHKSPNLKVLEIGAGTGGATTQMLHGFHKIGGASSYQSYTFTDISAGFFEKAKSKFSGWGKMDFRTLDIEKNPAMQGFDEKYDLIVASNVLHATSDITNTMKNVRSLLQDGGWLVMAELSSELILPGFLMGALPGWWLRSQVPTQAGPGLKAGEWQGIFANSGFSDIRVLDNTGVDGKEDPVFASVMLTSAIPPKTANQDLPGLPCVHIASMSRSARLQNPLMSALIHKGMNVTTSSLAALADRKWAGEWLILFDTIDDSFLSAIQARELDALKSWLSQSITCIWITHNVHLLPRNPGGGVVTGFARNLRRENDQLRLYTLDCSSSDDVMIVQTINKLFDRIHRLRNDDSFSLDYELAEKNGQVWSCRMEQESRLQRSICPPRESEIPLNQLLANSYRLTIQEAGIIDSLTFEQNDQLPERVPAGHLLIDVKAVGLEDRDCLVARGLSFSRVFGHECAGVVRQCGSNDTGFQTGDRVVAIGQGTFCTEYIAPSACCRKIPDWLAFEHAAYIPTSFVTAWYALIDVGRLSSNQRVLIANASLSQGLAAMHIATLFGAEVHLAINDSHHRSLADQCAIPASRVFVTPRGANGLEFSDTLRDQTYAVIFNPEPYQNNNFAPLLSLGGIYIDLSRGETQRHLPNQPIAVTNFGFTSIDMEEVYQKDNAYLGRLLNQAMGYIETGDMKGIMPVSITPLHDFKRAFTALLDGTREKQVITFTSNGKGETIQIQPKRLLFDEGKTYIITGGLGGLGRAIAVWMASHGAKHIVLMTSSPSRIPESRGFLNELKAYGCNSRAIVCNVAEMADVSRVVTSILTPIGGVIHSALRLSDRAFHNITVEDYKIVFDPKIQDCLNMHKALRNESLDFFVALSSGCGIVGTPGQSNYAASCTFLDSFARYRQSLGLHGVSIDLGYLTDCGVSPRGTSSSSSRLPSEPCLRHRKTQFITMIPTREAKSSLV
ncbi:hypothetical protein BDV59DRAFT_188903 [Aspergillus ambiguus]|uniref:uncharacterized protein n=1 Tax=Aspergillus ambiguus TaxID=176160 RepID=UPI003CCD0920